MARMPVVGDRPVTWSSSSAQNSSWMERRKGADQAHGTENGQTRPQARRPALAPSPTPRTANATVQTMLLISTERRSGRRRPARSRRSSAHGSRARDREVCDDEAEKGEDAGTSGSRRRSRTLGRRGRFCTSYPPYQGTRSAAVRADAGVSSAMRPSLQHDDAVRLAQGQRDVVQGEHRGLVSLAETGQHGRALDTIEGRDRFIPNQDRPPVIERPRHRGALLLAAREFAGLDEKFVRQVDEPEHPRDLIDVAAGGPGQRAQVMPASSIGRAGPYRRCGTPRAASPAPPFAGSARCARPRADRAS